MDVTLVVSLAFLVSPLLGYIVILLPITTRQKIVVAIVGLVILIALPLLVLLLAGGSGAEETARASPLAAR